MATYYKPPKPSRQNAGGGVNGSSGVSQPTRYAAYLRCSNDDQAEGDFSTIDTQRELTEQYVRERGGVLAGTWIDDGVSGTRKRRPGLDRMMAAAQGRQFDAVVCTYMSRLGRGDAYTIIADRLSEARVRVELVREQFADDVAGYAQQALTKFLDGMYPVQVRQWTVTKMEQMHHAGYYLGGAVPFGCKAIPDPSGALGKRGAPLKRLVTDDDTAPTLQGAFNLFLRSRCVMDVADYLRTATGATWCHHKTRYLLSNRIYVGVSTWRGIDRPNPATAMVDSEVFAAAQELLAEVGDRIRRRCRRPDIAAANPHAYYLRGIVFCGCCPLPEADATANALAPYYRMSTKDAVGRSGAIRYYECLNLQKRRSDSGCTIKRINAAALHDAIAREFALMAAHPWRVRKHIEAAAPLMPQANGNAKAHLESVRRRLRDNRKAVANLESAVKAGGAAVVGFLNDAIAKAVAERDVLESEERRLLAEIEAARNWRPDVDALRQTLSAFAGIWDGAKDEERAEMFGLLVDRVVMRSRQIAEVVILPAFGGDLRFPESGFGGYGDITGAKSAINQPLNHFSTQKPQHLPILVRIDNARITDREVSL